MKKVIFRVVISILLLIILAGTCLYVFRERWIPSYTPVVEQIGEISIRVRNDTSFVSTKLVVRNRSFIKIAIDSIKYKVSMFDVSYLESEKFLDIQLPKYGSDTIDFELKIPSGRILKDMKKARSIEDSASYEINVSLQYSTPLGKADIPINRVSKIKLPQPPELEIVDVRYEKIRRKYILAKAQIKIVNHNRVSLSIKKLSYSMKILEQGELDGNFKESVVIKPYGTSYVYLPVEITLKNAGRTIWDVLMNKDNYAYSIQLNAVLQSVDPVEKLIYLDLNKTGMMELKK